MNQVNPNSDQANTGTGTPSPISKGHPIFIAPENNHSDCEYSVFVQRLAKDPNLVLQGLTPEKVNLLHAAMGLASEAGEIIDEIKKHVFYGLELNETALVKEMGDAEWYMQLLRNTIGVGRQFVVDRNIKKLKDRHPNGFTTESAAAKIDELKPESEANKELQLLSEAEGVKRTRASLEASLAKRKGIEDVTA